LFCNVINEILRRRHFSVCEDYLFDLFGGHKKGINVCKIV
jgi:hypothetical protein